MARRDGDGWVTCSQGHRHWGRYGAAGLLAFAPLRSGGTGVLLERRSWWVNQGGTWGPPGGARDSHESAASAALREAAEECGLPGDAAAELGILADDHGGWSYQTVVASAAEPVPLRPASGESAAVSWVPAQQVTRLKLHPGFAASWPVLREALQPLTVIVDVANVMGSRADGWWSDRAGAARRLRDQITELAAAGLPALPDSMAAPALDLWYPGYVLVVEGAARSVAAAHGPAGRRDDTGKRVQVRAARGSGDDTIAEVAAEIPGRRLVVTADRELRERCLAAGAMVTGPRWLLGQL